MTENAQKTTEQGSTSTGSTISPPEGVGTTFDSPTPPPTATAASSGGGNGQSQQQSGKTVVMPQSALGRIKKEEREKGARQAKMELAQSYGFKSAEEFDAYLKGAKNTGGQPTGQQNGKPNGSQRPADQQASGDPGPAPEGLTGKAKMAWERERDKLQRELEASRRQAAHNDKKARQLRKQLEDKDTEISLREAAYSAGVKDVAYAITMLERHVANKTEEELNGFDEGKFFNGLRDSHPYLFGIVDKPATTGTTSSPAAPPPKAGEAKQVAASNGQVDARTMKQDEFQNMLRKRGLNPTL